LEKTLGWLCCFYADKVIVTTIQKLGLALDGANKNNYKEQLKPLASQIFSFSFKSVEALNEVSVLPLPVVCQI
jgi:type I site-specific restriction-modification system R (restriction) subunit